MLLLRLVRTLLLLVAGSVAGFAAAAAMLRGWLPSRGDATSDELALVAIFDGLELANRSAAFRGGSILAWFGGVALDLRDATLAPDARLEVRSAFGGVMVTVPREWRIEAEATAVFGGIDVPGTQPDDPEAPVLTVRATSFMGGVAIKH